MIADNKIVHGGKWSGKIEKTGKGNFATFTGTLDPKTAKKLGDLAFENRRTQP